MFIKKTKKLKAKKGRLRLITDILKNTKESKHNATHWRLPLLMHLLFSVASVQRAASS